MNASEHPNIAIALQQLAICEPDAEAIVASDLTLSREKLFRIVECYADCMLQRGVRQGDLVSIRSEDAIVTIASVFALSLIGAQYVPFGAELATGRLPVTHFLRSADQAPSNDITEIVIDADWSPRHHIPSHSAADMAGFGDNTSVCWISPTSGTTGNPKYIAITVATLNRRLAAIAADYTRRPTRLMMLFAASSRPFIIRAVAALVNGHVLIDSDSPRFAEAAKVDFMCASPQQIRLWLGEQRLQRRIPVLQVSGAKLPREQIARLLETFDRVEDVYGSNETIKAHVTVFQHANGTLNASTKAGPGTVEVVDAKDNLCPVGQTGRIRIKNDCMVNEYLGDPLATARHFKSGWYYPGDLGHWQPDGLLQIQGRDGEMVNIEGQKLYLADIDALLCSAPGIQAASCFEDPQIDADTRLSACVKLSDDTLGFETVEAAWLACVRALGVLAAPGSILIASDLPLTTDGIAKRDGAKKYFVDAVKNATPVSLKGRLFKFEIDYDA